ncbi:MAG: acyl carrier protein [Tenericutes bacterium HGW-Tenericutes-1]|jgi:acyl carrier protein|nr:MAG: acyl carrier protein [Tenericutes bacterium HGW-Tenericutes-1]
MIFEKVKQMISKEFSVDSMKLSRETRLEEDLNIDSLDAVELVMGLEDAFGVTISDEVAQSFKTLGEITDFVTEKIGA